MLVDTHAHLDFKQFKSDLDKVLANAQKKQVNHVINVGADLSSSINSVELAKKYENISASIGVHPHEASSFDEAKLEKLAELAKENKEQIVAIGEMGLDYHYDNSPRQKQREVFKAQLELAQQLNLPVIIHSREARDDTLEILREHASGLEGVLHCYAYDLETAKEVIDLGFYLSFNGILTFSNGELARVVKNIPRDKILLETDAPYLTPTPYRGQRNEPAYVYHVAEKVADILDLELEEVAQISTANARRLFAY